MRPFKILFPFALATLAALGNAQITSLTDDFDAEATGLNRTGFANWTVTGGNVDVIGQGFYDFLPGNGRYIDLDGSSSGPGLFATTGRFAPGLYTVGFSLAGSQRGDANDVTVRLGSYRETFTLASDAPLTAFTRIVSLTDAASLSFQNSGSDSFGALLDNVTVQAVPEPATLATLAVGGLVALRRRERAA